jgi:hypothetical protein
MELGWPHSELTLIGGRHVPEKDHTDPSWIPEIEEMEGLRRDMAAAVDADRGLTTGHQVSTVVDHPRHYNTHPSGIECIEVVRLCTYNHGNAIKYVWRYEDKDGHRDLCKARWSLQDILNSGHAHHLPYKAKLKLHTVNSFEPVGGLRHKYYSCLLAGDLRGAINLITEVVGEDDVTDA